MELEKLHLSELLPKLSQGTYFQLYNYEAVSDLDDIDFAKYESFPFNAGAQVYDLMERVANKAMEPENHHTPIPLFVVASEHDQTINTNSTLRLLNQWSFANEKERVNRNEEHNRSLTTLLYFGDGQKVKEKELSDITFGLKDCDYNVSDIETILSELI